MVGIITLVDPNQFKGFIEKQIASNTGRILTIKGPIFWHFTPNLSLEIYDLSLSNAPTFSNAFLTIKKATVSPELWSLLSFKLLVNLKLQDLMVNLNRNVIGQANWDDLQKALLEKQFAPRISSSFFLPYNVTIEGTTLHWQDARTHQNWLIKDLKVAAQKLPWGLSGRLVPINTSFHYEDITHKQSGNISFRSEWCLDKTAQQLDLQDLELIADIQELPTTILTGELHLQQFKNFPIIEGKLATINLSLERWLGLLNLPNHPLLPRTVDLKSAFKYQYPFLDVASFHLSLDNGGSLEGAFKTNVQGNTWQTFSLNGNFQASDLRIGLIPVSEIKTFLEAKDGIYQFTQLQGKFINSQHLAGLQIDIRNHIPEITLTDQIDTYDINELLSFFGEKDKISGRTQTKISLNTQGATLDECLTNLSGDAHITLMNGKLRGIALPILLQHAQATVTELTNKLVTKQSINIAAILTAELGEWKQQAINYQQLATPFRLIETNLILKNGKLSTTDFKLIHPDYIINGKGSVDFIHKDLEYQADALLNNNEISTLEPIIKNFLKETPLSIHVKGPFNQLSVSPELGRYAEGAIKLVHKEPIEIPKDNNLEKLFGFP